MIYMQSAAQNHREAGVVSILTVIMFMIFVSVLSIGFIKIVNDDQSQSTDSDLSASALASAQSGAEEAKRLLVLCRNNPTLSVDCAAVFNNPSCSAVLGNPNLVSRLDINKDGNDGIVTGNTNYSQRFTCMTISTLSDTVEGLAVEKDTSEVIPLVANGNYRSVRISWHATALDRNGPLTGYITSANGIGLPTQEIWASNGFAAAMRVQLTAFSKGGFDIDSLDPNTRTVFLLPADQNYSLSQTSVDLDTVSQRSVNPNNGTEFTPQLARCNGSLDYACSMTLQLPNSLSTNQFSYFMRVSSIYRDADIRIELLDNAGNRVQFDGVQPVIDVTGRANDVFRRVQTRVQFDTSAFFPQYAIETGELCKDMLVTDANATSTDNCHPGTPPPGGGGGGGGAPGGGDAAVIAPPDPNAGGNGNGNDPNAPRCWQQPQNDWFTPSCWRLTLVNNSQVAPGTVAWCEWTWGDGNSDIYPGTHANCVPGTSVTHQYTPQGPEGTYRTYNFVLTNHMNNGGIYTYPRTYRRPVP